MLKKLILPLFFVCSLMQAQESQTIEDKYAACERAYDECLVICEETTSNVDECVATCDEKLYNCNSKVEEEESKQQPVE
ncbi:hypothetical protein [Halarcobacter sp.]|uniref:hypothetical protein n=1 Tax=Halarcobacter sp. TaxID=2321133 RepID=UPI002AA73BED|nr:hypothetical protein [Halarcobacter sp.]